MQSFYKGVDPSVRVNINAAVEGNIMSKMPEDALDLIEEMANTQSLWTNDRAISRKGGPNEVDVLTILNAKLDSLSKRIDNMSVMQFLHLNCLLFVSCVKGGILLLNVI